MKFRVQLKDPDGIQDAFQDAARAEAQRLADGTDGMLTADDIVEKVREKMDDAVGAFFEFGDYCLLELDTSTGTAIVLKKGG